MSLFDRNGIRLFSRFAFLASVCCGVLCLTGCVSGQRQPFGGGGPSYAPLGQPTIIPRTQPLPSASPSIGRLAPPAALSGQIEIVPNAHPVESMSSQKLIDIAPAEPSVRDKGEVELLPSPVRSGYEELPPPPE